MNKFFISSAVAFTLTSTPLAAGPTHTGGDMERSGTAQGEQIWLAGWLAEANNGNKHGNVKAHKNGRSNGNAKAGEGNNHAAKGHGRAELAGAPKLKTNGKGAKVRRAFTTAERAEAFSRIVSMPTPKSRDMTHVLGATALASATPQLLIADIPDDELITYRNCPPGLAKKDPPCVPPGLAKQGVSYDEWASYDQDEYETIWLERRNEWLSSEAKFDRNHPTSATV